MFAMEDQALEQAGEIGRTARRRALVSITEQQAKLAHQCAQVLRSADDHLDWQAAGFSSSAQWFAQLACSDHRTAVRITRTSEALRVLPALEHAFGAGALSLDQIAAAVEVATPENDAELARVAVGRAPSAIELVGRSMVPPRVEDDQAIYARRALSMTWTRGRRELAFSGRLPLEQGLVFEQAIWDIAKTQRAADKRDGTLLGWQQSAADALVTLAGSPASDGVRRSPTAVILHLSDDEPPFLEGGGPVSPETAERLGCDARRLTIKLHGRDLVHSRLGRCASYAQMRALHKRSKHCQFPGCTAARELEAHHIEAHECGGETVLDNLILLCPRHHKRLHDQHIQTSGSGADPVFVERTGRAITSNQPHAPPG
jgi:hypothetical protein